MLCKHKSVIERFVYYSLPAKEHGVRKYHAFLNDDEFLKIEVLAKKTAAMKYKSHKRAILYAAANTVTAANKKYLLDVAEAIP